MLELFSGAFGAMPPAYQAAANRLTVRRYVKDIYHLDEYLERQGLSRDTAAFQEAYARRRDAIQAALSAHDAHTYVCAIFVPTPDGPVALASMRTVRGSRSQVQLSGSIGDPESSLPTHALFQGLLYPHQADFDPDREVESHLSEISRLVVIEPTEALQLVEVGVITQRQLQSLLTHAFDELIVWSIWRESRRQERFTAGIFNTQPKIARVLQLRMGLHLLPLFGLGVEPTAAALEPQSLSAPYFTRWTSELEKFVPAEVERCGVRAAIAALAKRGMDSWLDCQISLPFIILWDAACERAMQGLERRIEAHRAYPVQRQVIYA